MGVPTKDCTKWPRATQDARMNRFDQCLFRGVFFLRIQGRGQDPLSSLRTGLRLSWLPAAHSVAKWILCLLIAADVAGTVPAQAAPRGSHVLIVSIDGFPYDAFVSHRQRLPTLDKMAKAGASGPATTIFPSMTWPSHASLATGTLPARHRVLGNRFFDRRRRKIIHQSTGDYPIAVPAIWDLVTANGKEAGAILWAGTQRAPGLTYNIPEVYSQGHFKKGSTPRLLKTLRKAGIPTDKLGKFSKASHFTQDSTARDAAIWLIENKRPALMMVHFLSVDSLSHSYGPRTNQAKWGMELGDRYLADLIAAYERAGLKGKVNVFVVSDHGFMKMNRLLDADKVLYKAGLTKQLGRLERNDIVTVTNGHALFAYTMKGGASLSKRAAAVLKARPEVERIYWPSSYRRLGLPSSSKGRMPDFIAMSRPDAMFGRIRKKDVVVTGSWTKGMHGYLPSHKLNKPLFVAWGPDIRAGASVTIDNIDVAPTAAQLLGLSFSTPIDGKVKTEIIR